MGWDGYLILFMFNWSYFAYAFFLSDFFNQKINFFPRFTTSFFVSYKNGLNGFNSIDLKHSKSSKNAKTPSGLRDQVTLMPFAFISNLAGTSRKFILNKKIKTATNWHFFLFRDKKVTKITYQLFHYADVREHRQFTPDGDDRQLWYEDIMYYFLEICDKADTLHHNVDKTIKIVSRVLYVRWYFFHKSSTDIFIPTRGIKNSYWSSWLVKVKFKTTTARWFVTPQFK